MDARRSAVAAAYRPPPVDHGDESLRPLARLIARQAAREVFNRAVSSNADRLTEEGH